MTTRSEQILKNTKKTYEIGVNVNFKEAKELADLVSIVQDLKFTIDALLRLDVIFRKDQLLMKALV